MSSTRSLTRLLMKLKKEKGNISGHENKHKNFTIKFGLIFNDLIPNPLVKNSIHVINIG